MAEAPDPVLTLILQRLEALAERITALGERVSELSGRINSSVLLVKWVIFPLLIILAGLIGIKLTLPT